jgi:hypothetical protein
MRLCIELHETVASQARNFAARKRRIGDKQTCGSCNKQ